MSAVEEILSQIPLGQLAGQLGVNEQTAEQAARHALPAYSAGSTPTAPTRPAPRRSPRRYSNTTVR